MSQPPYGPPGGQYSSASNNDPFADGAGGHRGQPGFPTPATDPFASTSTLPHIPQTEFGGIRDNYGEEDEYEEKAPLASGAYPPA
jgi:hypothetical protein